MPDSKGSSFYVSAEKTLEALIAENPETQQSLPDLEWKVSWLQPLIDKWEQFSNKVKRLLEDFFNTFFEQNLAKNIDWRIIIEIGLWVLILSIVIALVWVIARAIRNYRLEDSGVRSQPINQTEKDKLEKLLRLALDQQQLPLATRMRWKLFLARKNFSSDKTPFEILQSSEVTSLGYLLMFAKQGNHASFEQFDQQLARLEANHD